MVIQYVATSVFVNAPIAYESIQTFGGPDRRSVGESYAPISATGGQGGIMTTVTPGGALTTDNQMWINLRLPKQGSMFAPSYRTADGLIADTASDAAPMLGHKWRGQNLTNVGGNMPGPLFQADTAVSTPYAHMTPIAGVALAPFYACNNMLPNKYCTYTPGSGQYSQTTRTSGFLIGDCPRVNFGWVINQAAAWDPNYSALSTNPACPYTYAANIPAAAANPTNAVILGANAYSYFLRNPTGTTFNNNIGDSPSGWGAPFRANTVDIQNHNGPYAFPQFGNGPQQVQYRLVSAELAIKYTGTEEERGGLVTILEHPEHQSVVGYTLAQMQAYDVCRTEAVMANKWHSCFYSGPINDTETEFSSVPLVTPFMSIVVSGGTNLSFQVEGWANYEFTGDAVRNKIMVCADEQGGVAVATACKVLAATKRFGHGQGKAVLREASRQISAGSGVRF